jgi:exodeoxyribonuclease VII large subunit
VSPSARFARDTQRLDELDQRIRRAVLRRLASDRERLRWLDGRAALAGPQARVREAAARHAALDARLRAAGAERLRRARERLTPLERTLNAVSPHATLARGYAIVTAEHGAILRDAAQAPPGTTVEAQLARGRIRAKVQ